MAEFRREMQQRMTAAAAHIRDPQAVKQAIREGERQYELISSGQVCLETDRDLLAYFQNKQLCLTHLAVLHSIAAYLDAGGGSRGSYLVVDPEGEQVHPELGSFATAQKTRPPQADPALPVSRWEASHRVGGSAADTSR